MSSTDTTLRPAATASGSEASGASDARRGTGPPTEARVTGPLHRRLRAANAVVGVIHAAQAVAILVLANDFAIPVVATFLDGPPGSGTEDSATLFDVRFGWAIAAFLLLAAIDHLLMASPRVVGWYESKLAHGRNPARWAEYSISASLMIVLIAMLTGITSAYALLAVAGVNAAMILFGHLMERTNPDRDRVDWLPFWFGCVAGIVPWLVIGLAFGGAVVRNGDVPAFVVGIFVSLFVLFNTFAINQALQYRKVGPWRSYVFGEGAYIVLSLTAKTALAWQVFGGTLAQ